MAADEQNYLLNQYAETKAKLSRVTEQQSSEANGVELSETNGVELSETTEAELSAAQRARMERQRLRARALRDARLVQSHAAGRAGSTRGAAATDSGGGFLLEECAGEEPALGQPPPAPIVDPAEQPHCLECERAFPQSYLFDAFGYNVCDDCRDDEDAHALITRTEAKSAYLLKECDLDLRPPALLCVRRRNPHGAGRADMRLYLRAQVAERARLVWRSAEALQAERERREAARTRSRHSQTQRRLRALRMDVRSSVYSVARAHHSHSFGAEQYDAAADRYSRACACGHVETYEKM